MMDEKRNLDLLMDFYQLTMSQGYLNDEMKDKKVVFDVFYRTVPDNGGYVIFAGLEQVVEYIMNLRFSEDDISSLREMGLFNEKFLEYLREFEFKGDVYSVLEGTVIFPNEPIMKIIGTPMEAQLIETMVLLTVNHQSLIATKASRIVKSAEGKKVIELGARRAQGYDGAIYGARASYIGGVSGTATTVAGSMFDIPVVGTMAHSWVQMFGSEYSAFEAYAMQYPDSSTLLIDTYDVLGSGLPNAIRIDKDVLQPQGSRLFGVRLDSGDIAYLSKKIRSILDANGLHDCKIIASNSLDEDTISSLLEQGAEVDTFGVGERLITSMSAPVLGGVYKLAAVSDVNGEFIPKIKISENVEKVTNPGNKKVWRLIDKNTYEMIADVIALADEEIDESKPYSLFDPVHTWKKRRVKNFRAIELLRPIIIQGELKHQLPALKEIREYADKQKDSLWTEITRLKNPHKYYVDLSEKLWNLKTKLLTDMRGREE